MNECVAFYQKQAQQHVSRIPWIVSMQKAASQQLMERGFPTRQDENWKYTTVDSFLKHRFMIPDHSVVTTQSISMPEVSIARHLYTMVDGHLKTSASLPFGVIVLPLLDALVQIPDQIEPYLGQILPSEHAFHALNMLMLGQGLVIYVPKNVVLSEPIWLRHWQSQPNQAVHWRHLLVVESGSHVSLVEEYSGNPELTYHTNTVTEVNLAERASLTHYKIQRESPQSYHVGHIAVNQSSHSQFNSHWLSTGGQWVRNDITIHLNEPHARCTMNGMYVPLDGQHMDQHTSVYHRVPHCQSAQDYKGILKGHARAVFNGRVVVDQDAQHTVAQQQNKNILLSAQAEIDTKPELNIFADDVICSHGATVGQLNQDALFYLAARGLDEKDAHCFLLNAFMTDNIRAIPNESMAVWIADLLNEQIVTGHNRRDKVHF